MWRPRNHFYLQNFEDCTINYSHVCHCPDSGVITESLIKYWCRLTEMKADTIQQQKNLIQLDEVSYIDQMRPFGSIEDQSFRCVITMRSLLTTSFIVLLGLPSPPFHRKENIILKLKLFFPYREKWNAGGLLGMDGYDNFLFFFFLFFCSHF